MYALIGALGATLGMSTGCIVAAVLPAVVAAGPGLVVPLIGLMALAGGVAATLAACAVGTVGGWLARHGADLAAWVTTQATAAAAGAQAIGQRGGAFVRQAGEAAALGAAATLAAARQVHGAMGAAAAAWGMPISAPLAAAVGVVLVVALARVAPPLAPLVAIAGIAAYATSVAQAFGGAPSGPGADADDADDVANGADAGPGTAHGAPHSSADAPCDQSAQAGAEQAEAPRTPLSPRPTGGRP